MPAKKTKKTDWIKTKPEEVEKIIVELGHKNTPPEKIGLILRDEYGIPKAKMFGKKISQTLKKHKIEINSEHNNISKKIDNLSKHFEKHSHDYTAQRSIVKYRARLNKLKKN